MENVQKMLGDKDDNKGLKNYLKHLGYMYIKHMIIKILEYNYIYDNKDLFPTTLMLASKPTNTL